MRSLSNWQPICLCIRPSPATDMDRDGTAPGGGGGPAAPTQAAAPLADGGTVRAGAIASNGPGRIEEGRTDPTPAASSLAALDVEAGPCWHSGHTVQHACPSRETPPTSAASPSKSVGRWPRLSRPARTRRCQIGPTREPRCRSAGRGGRGREADAWPGRASALATITTDAGAGRP